MVEISFTLESQITPGIVGWCRKWYLLEKHSHIHSCSDNSDYIFLQHYLNGNEPIDLLPGRNENLPSAIERFPLGRREDLPTARLASHDSTETISTSSTHFQVHIIFSLYYLKMMINILLTYRLYLFGFSLCAVKNLMSFFPVGERGGKEMSWTHLNCLCTL